MSARINKIIKSLDAAPSKEYLISLKTLANGFISKINAELKKQKISADTYLAGSFAKGTLVKKSVYDIDIYVRFDWKYDNISGLVEKVLKRACKTAKLKLIKKYGSRIYFNAVSPDKKVILEIIPVTKIKHPKEARNVTDLSYFHVNYIKKKLNSNPSLTAQIILAKTFCHAQNVYGAESYINGFSGYALECLIIYYNSFEKMLKELVKVKPQDRIVIDIEREYRNKDNILFELNESKLKSPIILIDPTFKERNALASLSRETFKKFQDAANAFLKNPSSSFFIKREINAHELIAKAKRLKAEFLHINLSTDRQPGDIAGTKLKKFSEFIIRELSKYFTITQHEFQYDDKQSANVYLILKSKKEIVKIGPPIKLAKNVEAFKKANKNAFIKNEFVHAKVKINFSAKTFINNWKKANKNKVDEMGITQLNL